MYGLTCLLRYRSAAYQTMKRKLIVAQPRYSVVAEGSRQMIDWHFTTAELWNCPSVQWITTVQRPSRFLSLLSDQVWSKAYASYQTGFSHWI